MNGEMCAILKIGAIAVCILILCVFWICNGLLLEKFAQWFIWVYVGHFWILTISLGRAPLCLQSVRSWMTAPRLRAPLDVTLLNLVLHMHNYLPLRQRLSNSSAASTAGLEQCCCRRLRCAKVVFAKVFFCAKKKNNFVPCLLRTKNWKLVMVGSAWTERRGLVLDWYESHCSNCC